MTPQNSYAPPPKASAGRSFLVAAIVMLALGGGLLIWKATRPPPADPGPVAAPQPAPAPPRPVLNPPPPPPDEVPAPEPPPEPAKPEPARPAAPRRLAGCGGECAGSASSDLQSALRGRAGQARSCYERALSNNSSLQGSLLVNVRVAPNGGVCSASLGKNTLGDASVSNCVLQRFRSGKYPKPSDGCVDVAVPINFVPRQP